MTSNHRNTTHAPFLNPHHFFSHSSWYAVLAIGLLVGSPVLAQDAGSLLRDIEREQKRLLTPSPALPAPAKPPAIDAAGPRVRIEHFRLQGNSLLSDAELQAALSRWTERELSFAELQQAADAVAERYRRAGYLVRAYLPEQSFTDGTVTLAVIEARMGEVSIDDGGKKLRISADVARDTLTARQQQGGALNLDQLQRSTILINDLPGVSAATILTPSAHAGATDIILQLQDKPMLSGSAQLDNTGAHSTGDNRASANLSLANISGKGDQAQLAAMTSAGSNYWRLDYSLPVKHDGLRGGIHASGLHYALGKDFAALHANGTASTWGMDLRYPVVRGSTHNLSVAAAWDARDYLDNAADAVISNKKMSVTSAGISGDRRDSIGGGGSSFAGASLTAGSLDLAGNAADFNADQISAQRNGSFRKFTWYIARMQKLAAATDLLLSVNGQMASKNLDSSEIFVLGGPAGVRAYPGAEGSGDEGWLLTAEVRQTLSSKLILTGFYDHGHVLQHKTTWAGWNNGNLSQPLAYNLKGAGVALTWTKTGSYSARLVLAHRLGGNPLANVASGNDGDGTKVMNRLWLSLIKYI